jgi:hypothetical protein
MKALFAAVTSALFCLGLAGCISSITVTKATPETPGIHYCLPQPFVQVTPNKDGTVVVEVIYLPDPDNEYAVQASSVLGSYTIDFNRNEKGFLETVSFNADTTGIAKQLIQSGAAVRSAEIDAKAAKAKDDAADAKDARDKVTAAVAAADKAQKDAQTAVDIAQKKLNLLVEISTQPKPPEDIDKQIIAAKLTLAEAEVKRDAATVAYNAAKENPAAANAAPTTPMAPEPVFLKVVMTKDTVRLVQEFAQEDRATWVVPTTDATTTELTVLPFRQVVHPNEKNKALIATVKADRELVDATFSGIDPPLKETAWSPVFSLRADKMTVDIEFPPDTARGRYTVDGEFKNGPKDAVKKTTRQFIIQIEQ